MIDWDEAHVDVADLDLVLPHNAADLDDEPYDRSRAAASSRPPPPPAAGVAMSLRPRARGLAAAPRATRR